MSTHAVVSVFLCCATLVFADGPPGEPPMTDVGAPPGTSNGTTGIDQIQPPVVVGGGNDDAFGPPCNGLTNVDFNCPIWAERPNECSKPWMKQNCAAACARCDPLTAVYKLPSTTHQTCYDDLPECGLAEWKATCRSNAKYMIWTCPLSCNVECTRDGVSPELSSPAGPDMQIREPGVELREP